MKKFLLAFTGALFALIAVLLLTQHSIRRHARPQVILASLEMRQHLIAESARAKNVPAAAGSRQDSENNPADPSPSRDIFWQLPAAEPEFANFADWARRYENAPSAAAKRALVEEGEAIARVRLGALADLIQSNPERALQLSVPASVRERLPGSIQALLETKVNDMGALAVMGTLPSPGSTEKIPAIFRVATINSESYHTFTYAEGLRFVTKARVPLNGIAVPAEAGTRRVINPLAYASKLLALDPSPARVLEQDEIAAIKTAKQQDPLCSVSGQSWEVNNAATSAELGGQTFTFCGPAHLREWYDGEVAAAGLTTPSGKSGFLAESSYTEGRKRMFMMRPYWTNQPVARSTNSAISDFLSFSNYMWQMSYGKLVFAPLGQGSEISAELLLPGNVNSYVSGLGNSSTDVWKVVKDVATSTGYNLNNFDFLYYLTTDKPSASYCGLGFVGGVGFHLANSCFGADVASHEYGHNLGLNHAHFWDTSQQSIIGAGENIEYGDSNDPMGGGGNPNQFNARYKNYLGWITNSDIATIPATGSNRYRLYCFDLDYSTNGVRGLKFARSGSQNYWVNFRQRKTGSPALMNGVQLYWTDNGNGGSYLLDVRLKGNADNNAIVIGRTFSDTNLNFHLTPIGKGRTYPESIDVVAVTGAQPGNQPPVVTLAASTSTPSPGQTVTLSATASDPNGDALAYYWEFGDGAESYSSDNNPVQNHSFSTAGEYMVRCVVSDMRGGATQRLLLIRVGSPSTSRISGHTLTADNKPLAGIRVSADATHYTYSDTDGSYTIVNLPTGSYTLAAIEPVSGSIGFATPFFNNPVTVGPSQVNMDFVVGTNSPPVTLSAAGATWKYLDTGMDQGTAWRAAAFDDTLWKGPSPAQLGYGESDEATVIGYGPDANNKYTTYYFRRWFNVADPNSLTNFALNLLRDDGGIVYLNGVEVFRSNMPTGNVTYATFASTAIDDQFFFRTNLPGNLFLAGSNVLAVEIHQADLTSSDVSFDLFVTAQPVSSAGTGTVTYLTAPQNRASFTAPASITLTGYVASTSATFTNVEFFDGATKIGEDASSPYTATLNTSTTGNHALTCVSVDSGGIRRTSPVVNVTVTAPVVAPPAVSLTLVPTGSVWRYWCTNVAAPNGWQNRNFTETDWIPGTARLGFNTLNTNLATIIYGGPGTARYAAAHFRAAFVVNDPSAITNMSARLARDDGAIVYLNGVELLRDNINNGVPVSFTYIATNASDNGAVYYTFNASPAGLVAGTNIVGVAVYQSSATSSDLAFDLGISALASTNRPRGCWLVGPTNGATILSPGSVTLAAEAVAGGTLGVTNVEFYSGATRIGQDATTPFSFTWNNPPPGAHALTAVAHDSAGDAITSAVVNVSVTAPPTGDALVSFGDVWKFLDDGSNPGTQWTLRNFNDTPWMSGPARLGYGNDGEVTVVSYGTNANWKHVTTYFRKRFVVSSPSAFNGLLLRLIRDDGAVVYINGTEVFRTNLQAGPVSYNSLALAAVGGADETTPLDVLLGTSALVAGTNVIAVEMHQDSVTSSDLGLDLALIGLHSTNTADGIYLTSPANNTHYNMPANVGLAANAASSSSTVTRVDYFADGSAVGQSVTPPYSVTWNNAPSGTHQLVAVATLANSSTMTSPPVSVVVGPAPPQTTPVFNTFVSWQSQWKYFDSATAVASNWQAANFDDTAWPSGNARFGWGLDGEATQLTQGRITHYFRKSFVCTNGGQLDSLIFDVIRDDGVVVYLNGAEVFRTNMPAGPVNGSTLATTSINTPDETIPVEYVLPAEGSTLVHGTNVIAVELHQSAATSSDAGFDLALYGEGSTQARVYLYSPTNGATFGMATPIPLAAHANVPSGRTLGAVEFYSDGVKVGQTNVPPFTIAWSGASTGAHTIVARVVDTMGDSVTSAPVQINVGYQLVSLVLVPAGSVWRYLDNGSDQGTTWYQTNFADSGWEYGPGELGYGDLPDGRPEATVLCCSNAAVKSITYYFRHSFVVPPDHVLTNLTFRLLRDDGAVVYLNGREMYRSNMPIGTVTYLTPASAAVSSTDEATYFVTTMATNVAHAGTNVLAVEIHQNSSASSDLSFDLQLEAIGYVTEGPPPVLVSALGVGGYQVAWPVSASGWTLYSSLELGPGASWQPVNAPVTPTNGQNVVTLPPSNSAAFFQLRKP